MAKIYILDVTNRDGVQTARVGMSKLEKTITNLLLDEFGVYQSEFGFPMTLHEINYLRANLELQKRGAFKNGIILEGWVRAIRGDVEKARKYVPELEHLNLSISTSEQMLRAKLNKSQKEVIELMVDAVKAAKDSGFKTIGVNAEDASRTDMGYLLEFANAAKEAGADRIRYCDTLGYDSPFATYDRVYKLAKEVGLPVEMHMHNDLGMAVATSVAGAKAAVDAGVDAYINTTVNGIGERAGNADLVATVLALLKSDGIAGKYELGKPINLKVAYKLAKFVSYAFRVPLPINQVGVGDNAFAHESGIHADGALKDRRNYELYDPSELGRDIVEEVSHGRVITVGEYSGIKGFRHVVSKLGLKVDEDKERWIMELVRYANLHIQKPLLPEHIEFVVKYPDIARQIMTVVPPEIEEV